MNTNTLPGSPGVDEAPRLYNAHEYKLVSLRECPTTTASRIVDTPEKAEDYFRQHIAPASWFDPEREIFVVLLVNARRSVKGHNLVSTGTADTILVHPREVFAPAVVIRAHALILMHNHPSGDPTPSEADIKVTRDLIRAGQVLKIDVLDHVIIGTTARDRARGYASLRELGYFYS